MRPIWRGPALPTALVVVLASYAWGQGGRAGRAAAAQQTAPPAAAPGRGGAPAAAPGGTGDFFNFDPAAAAGAPIPEGPPAESHQRITANGEAIAYTARAGFLPVRNATTGQPEAHLFYTSYVRDGVSDASTRPLVFFLGGAPGVAAAWEEFGGLGPKRMKWASDGSAGSAPYEWAENPHSLIGQADLVFVNPVGTAFSRPDQPGHAQMFWNTAGDVASLAEFVRVFLNTSNRRNSPLFLAGEDSATGRTAGLAAYLTEHQVPVQGVILLSVSVSTDSMAGDAESINVLPSLIMAAWYHKKLPADLSAMSAEQISGQARQFASREYLHALYKGDRMTADERGKVIADLAKLTGLSRQFLISNNLRISMDRFAGELMHDPHRGLARSDSRVTGYVPAAAGGGRGGRGGFGVITPPVDFNESALAGGFQTAYEAYLRRELTFAGNSNSIFYLSSGGVSGFMSTGADDASLSAAFARNPKMRLFVGVNYFDLGTPFYAAEFTLAHLNVSPEVRAHNITVAHFEAGQMAYVDSKASASLQDDLSRFVQGAAARK